MTTRSVFDRAKPAVNVVFALLLSGAAACNADEVDVGDAESAGADGSEGGSDTWVGYVEAFQFESGSDRIELRFTSRSASDLAGAVVLGDGPAPPVDPSVGYPPGADVEHLREYDGYGARDAVVEGFEYTMVDGAVDQSRIRFVLDRAEGWKEWCEGQTPYDIGNPDPEMPSHMCLPNHSCECDEVSGECSIRTDDSEVYCDEVMYALCADGERGVGFCVCTADGCAAGDAGQLLVDMSFDGDTASGTVVPLPGRESAVFRVTRQ